MKLLRGSNRNDAGEGLKDHQLCNGPSKLCTAFSITKNEFDKTDLISSNKLWIEDNINIEDGDVVISSRIGLDKQSDEWKNKPWRFYILNNKSVSVRDKVAEQKLNK